MSGRYPTEPELDFIKNYDCLKKSMRKLLDYVGSIWEYGEWGWKKEGFTYYVATGGWSGNEELIMALQENRIFWSLCWYRSERGGHYIFKVPRIRRKK